MKSFDKNRIISENWKIKNIKESVPTFIINPVNESTDKALVFVPGLNGNGSMIKYFNNKIFDNCFLFSFDARAQGNNKNKASRFYSKYVWDIKFFIDEIKQKYPNIKKIYVCGESWGSTLSFLFYKKFSNDANGVIGWNMPYDVVDVSKEKKTTKLKNSMKILLTFLTSINTYNETVFINELTNNKVLIKVISLVKNDKLNNKVLLAAWRSFKKSWKFLEKQNDDKKILYIQSKEDVLFSNKGLDKLNKIKNSILLEKGYHILTFDENANDNLFVEISKIIYN